jgi:hypothetical protein
MLTADQLQMLNVGTLEGTARSPVFPEKSVKSLIITPHYFQINQKKHQQQVSGIYRNSCGLFNS